MNRGAFLALAMRPALGKNPQGPFVATVGLSFVLTTSGYLGAVWTIARGALAVG